MLKMDNLTLVSHYLSTYQGRDKFLKILSYAAKLASGVPSSEKTVEKFKKFGSEMSGCRVILRLLDDISVWHDALTFDWRRKEPNWLIRLVDLTQIVVDVVYSPVESICWAGEHKFISINTKKWDSATTWFWITSICLSFIKSAYNIKQLKKHETCLYDTRSDTGSALDKVVAQRRSELLTCIRLILDLSYAVSYLPSGTLWGGQLKTWQVGALGAISSLIGLYQALSKQAGHSKRT